MDYTRQAKEVLAIAEKSAKEMAHPYVGTEHLLLGIAAEGEGMGAKLLREQGLDESLVRELVELEKDVEPLPLARGVVVGEKETSMVVLRLVGGRQGRCRRWRG